MQAFLTKVKQVASYCHIGFEQLGRAENKNSTVEARRKSIIFTISICIHKVAPKNKITRDI